jgi:hypothetical protein
MRKVSLLLILTIVGFTHVYSQSNKNQGNTYLYQSPDSLTHDPWFLNIDGKVHLFHLDGPWHASSADCVNWQVKKNLDFQHQNLPYLCSEPWTGCAMYHEGKIFLFWTSNQWINNRFCNSICLAISEDGGETFKQHQSNPIIKADPRWYDTESDPTPPYDYHGKFHQREDKNLNLMDWRDISIIKDPGTGIFHGFITARLRGKEDEHESACIARVTSKDLLHWEVHPPAFIPGTWGLHEVPTVFELNQKWYLTVMGSYPLPGNFYAGDSCVGWSHLVGQADNLEDEFILVEGNGIMSGNGSRDGYSMRTVKFKGEMLAFDIRHTTDGHKVLSQGVKLLARKEGGLDDLYWAGNDKRFGPDLSMAPEMIRGQRKLGMVPENDGAYMLRAKIRLVKDCSAGITFGQTKDHPGYTFFLDPENNRVELVKGQEPGKDVFFGRRWDIEPNGEYQIRFVFINNLCELYVNERLVGNVSPKDMHSGGVSLITCKGKANFSELHYCGPNYSE